MASHREKYLEHLSFMINDIELGLGLNLENDGTPLKDNSMYEFLKFTQSHIMSSSKSTKSKYSTAIVRFGGGLSYISERASFFNLEVLDFRLYDHLDIMVSMLLEYQEVSNVKMFKEERMESFIEYMTLIEGSSSDIKRTLSYRYIRLFLLLILTQYYADASIVSLFIKDQIWLNEGFNPRLKFSKEEVSNIQKEIVKERKVYSRKLKDKIRSSVSKVIKKSKHYDDLVSDTVEDSDKKTNTAASEAISRRYKSQKVNTSDSNSSGDIYNSTTINDESIDTEDSPSDDAKVSILEKTSDVKEASLRISKGAKKLRVDSEDEMDFDSEVDSSTYNSLNSDNDIDKTDIFESV